MNISKITRNNITKEQTGTPNYASPEVWNKELQSNKIDIWSLGCVI